MSTASERAFSPAAPDKVWTSDINYIWTDEGWLYLAVVLDLFNREVIGWSIKARMTSDLVGDALTMACFRRKPLAEIIFHSSLKNERVHGRRYATRDEARADLFEYIAAFYNRRRRHSTLGYKSPEQFLQDWRASPKPLPEAA